MRKLVLGALVASGLAVAAAVAQQHCGEVFAQRMTPTGHVGVGDQLIVVPGPMAEKGQLLTIVDPKMRAMSVYQIDQATGKIALRSVRNIRWDLQMLYLDNEGPLPQEIRALLEQR
ncbi:MAG: hypothetical protein JXB62_00420 [Pirellulales bacterium]|nr:hypothetical protein [Pirellulales bacterium]